MKIRFLSFLVILFGALQPVTTHAGRPIVLNPERAGQTATLMNNGKVLICGGVNEEATLTSGLLYDPNSQNFRRLKVTGSLVSARADHTATLLTDGRVLVTGGDLSDGTDLDSAEIYDPVTGVFTQLASHMSVPRSKHTATLLQDGRVLLVGGATADLFDPVSQTFTQTTGTPVDRRSHSAVRLPDGTVLITGGYLGRVATTSAEIFNPTTQTFTVLSSPMRIPRANHETTLLNDGTVLVTGGFSGTSPHAEVDIFNPTTKVFTSGTNMLYHRSNHRALLLTDGRVLVVGGTTLESGFLDVNETYNPSTKTWTALSKPMNENRTGHTATLMPDGSVFVAGGITGNKTLQSAEVLDPVTHLFTPLGNMQVARNQHTDTLLADGKVLLAGGSTDALYLNSAEVFDPANNSFTLVGSLSQARKSHTATRLLDDRVLITGGKTATGDSLVAELYTPSTGQFQLTGSMNEVRSLQTATLLPGGKVLVAGGRKGATPIKTAELYDPAAGTFTYTGSMNIQRKRHAANLLLDNTVLVEGGASLSNGQPVNDGTPTAEVYSPTAGTWTQVGDMHVGRTEHAATLLNDGTVLVTGGISKFTMSDLYHPDTQMFTLADQVLQPRQRHIAILLPPVWGSLAGQVLVIGGASTGNSVFGGLERALDSVEIYDPAADQFTLFGTMTTARQNHTATLLEDGRILIAGGVSSPAISGTAELVRP